MEWLKNLSSAVEHIEDHLDKDISYDEATRIACCSTYYFHRLFSYVAGISLSEYIRKRRFVGIRTPLTENMEEKQRIVPCFWKNTLETDQFSSICSFSNEAPKGIWGVSIYHAPNNIFTT